MKLLPGRGAARFHAPLLLAAVLCGSLALASMPRPASATTLIANLPQSVGAFNSDFAINNNLAAGFGMPAGGDYFLDSLTLQMTVFSSFTFAAVSLYEGSDLAPSGTAVATFTNPTFTNGVTSPYVFVPTASFTLLSSTNYWIVLEGDGATLNSVNWDSSSPSVTATGLATFLGQTIGESLPPTTTFAPARRFSFQVDGTAVPEPSTGLLAVLAALGCLIARRRGVTA